MRRQVLKGPGGITLVLDPTDADTPALVYSKDKRYTATYDCAAATGELDCGTVQLTREQSDWLNESTQLDAAVAMINFARRDDPRYQS